MPMTKPDKDRPGATWNLKNNPKESEPIRRRPFIGRWSSLDARDKDIFDLYISSAAFRAAINTRKYILADNQFVVKPIGNQLLIANISVDEFITAKGEALEVFGSYDIALHKTYPRKSYGGGYHRRGHVRGHRAPVWGRPALGRKASGYSSTPVLKEAYKASDILNMSKKDFEGIIGGVGGQEPPNNFRLLLEEFLSKKNITIEYLSELTGIPDRTIRRMKNEAKRPSSLEYVIAICIGLTLRPSQSEDLIKAAGYKLKKNKKENAYQFLIDCCYEKTVSECNAFLKRMGFVPLTDI